jgi:hypothetical protein
MCLKLQLGQAAASSASFTTSCSSLRRFQSSAAASSRARAAAAWKDWDAPSVEIPKGGRPWGLHQRQVVPIEDRGYPAWKITIL